MIASLQLSIVVPVYNESGNIEPLARQIDQVFSNTKDIGHYEIIFINDHSTDTTRQELKDLQTLIPALRIITHEYNAGQSRALLTGVIEANSPIIAMLDGDGQNDPADIPQAYRQLTRKQAPENLQMVSGYRVKRHDHFTKKIASRFGNSIRKFLLKDGADDTGCGMKVFYRKAFLDLPYFDHIHRYLPAFIKRNHGLTEFIPVNHRERQFGRSKYSNLGRLWVSFMDIIGVMWLLRRARNPGKWTKE